MDLSGGGGGGMGGVVEGSAVCRGRGVMGAREEGRSRAAKQCTKTNNDQNELYIHIVPHSPSISQQWSKDNAFRHFEEGVEFFFFFWCFTPNANPHVFHAESAHASFHFLLDDARPSPKHLAFLQLSLR